MAIIEEIGLEVKVKVDGSEASEYPDEEPDIDDDARSQTTESCYHYVKVVDNAEVAIHVGVTPGINTGQEWISRSPNHTLRFSAAFDGGQYVAATMVLQGCKTRLMEGVYDPENQTFRKFLLKPVTTGRFLADCDDLDAANTSTS